MPAIPEPTYLPDLYRELDACVAEGPMTPSKLRRFFLLLLRSHYSDPQNYGPDIQDTLSCLWYSPDDPASTVSVELQGSRNPQTKQHGVWVALGNFQTKQLGFGHRSNDYEPDNATERLVMRATCQLLIRHDAPSLDTAFDMGWTTFCFLLGFSETILDGMGGDGAGFDPKLVGQPQIAEQSPKDRFRVDVGANLTLNVAVATTTESHRLKRISITPTTT